MVCLRSYLHVDISYLKVGDLTCRSSGGCRRHRLARADHCLGEELKRAADLRMRQVAKAAHEQERIDADCFQLFDLCRYLFWRTDQHAANGCQLVVTPSAPDTTRELLESLVRVRARRRRRRQRR